MQGYYVVLKPALITRLEFCVHIFACRKVVTSCKVFLLCLLCSVFLLLSTVADAQVPTPLPSPVEPRPDFPVEKPKFPKEKVPEVEIEIEPLGNEAPPGASKVYTVLQDIVIEDNTVYEAEFLLTFYQQFIGKEINLTQLFVIADQIQKQYRTDGYMLTRVIVPPQSVKDGVFHLRVIEGFIDDVKVEGKIGPVKERLTYFLRKVVQNKPVTEQDLERYLLLANDFPGIKALGFLRSSKGEIGASQLIVSAERKPFDAYAMVNNRGSKFTGPYRFSMMVRENSATFLGEQIEGSFTNTLFDDEQHYGQLAYRQFLNRDGLKLSLSASYGLSNPGYLAQLSEVETEILTVTGLLSYPLIRSRSQNLYIDAGFQTIDEQVDFAGIKASRDRIRVFFANASYDLIDNWRGQSIVSFGIRQGVNALGASEERERSLFSRVHGVPDHTSLNLRASRYQVLWEQLGLLLSGSGQYAFNTLLNAEEFKVGGEVFGRGYNPAELTGDNGVGLTAELQYTLLNPVDYWQSLQGYSFYDFGAVWNRDPDTDSEQSLASAGFGVRNQLLKNLYVNLEVAWPLTRAPNTFSKDHPRFFFQVLARY